MTDPSEATPGPKHESKNPPYVRGGGPNPNFHDYGRGNLKRIVENTDKERKSD